MKKILVSLFKLIKSRTIYNSAQLSGQGGRYQKKHNKLHMTNKATESGTQDGNKGIMT